MDAVLTMLSSPLMQRALIAALIVGICAPVIGTYLVQRRLALLGDGIGHVALTGVALGWLVGNMIHLTPGALAVPGAVVAAIAGSVGIEIVRTRGRTTADLALALLFYGGIASGILIIRLAGGTNANLLGYLFGSIATVTTADLIFTVVLGTLILAVGLGLRHALFAASQDEDFARASGLPVRALNILVSIVAALTVTVAMRVVGLLLVSALMIVPVAIAQQVARSFLSTMIIAQITGALVSVVGLSLTWWIDIPPGATIVVLAVVAYLVVFLVRPRPKPQVDPHPHLPDDVEVTT